MSFSAEEILEEFVEAARHTTFTPFEQRVYLYDSALQWADRKKVSQSEWYSRNRSSRMAYQRQYRTRPEVVAARAKEHAAARASRAA